MSQSSGEKLRDETSSQEMDEDSGHDSVDDINSAADERERIASLETAVAWIRQEVDQLKTYDKDILQELWKIRNTIQTLREVDRKPSKEESRFLDDTIEDRSPTPESQTQEPEDLSLPSSPSPPPDYLAMDGNVYREGTLNLMATAPSHLRKSSDDLVLEEFFGSEQLTKLNIFKKQISCDNLPQVGKEAHGTGDGLPLIAEEGLRPGFSMPNISNPPSSSVMSYPETRDRGGQVRLRLAKDNHLSGANRLSYDVASEMEQLRARLQETAKQELAEFDRKYSPKLHHSNVMSAEAANHSRQGSLDSSIPQQQVATSPLAALQSHGHSRQHSLPIDPKFLRQTQSNETTPSLATTYKSGHSPSLGSGHVADRQSPTPPLLFGHIRQISGGSMSSEGGTFSPPLTPTDFHTPQNILSTSRPPARPGAGVGAGLPIQHFKQSNPPGMARIGSDGMYNRRTYGSSNSLSRAPPEGEGNGGNRTGNAQPHYSTSVIKRGGKRGSLEITPPSMPHPQYGGGLSGMYKYEDKVSNGRPNAYEQPKRRSYGEDVLDAKNYPRVGNGGVGRYTQVSPPRMEGNVPSSPKLTRMPERRGDNRQQQQPSTAITNPSSKLQTRASEPANLRQPSPSAGGHGQQAMIEPYMTSNHVKSQMPNFNYTPFSQQRSYTVSGGDAPKLTKRPKSAGKNTWI